MGVRARAGARVTRDDEEVLEGGLALLDEGGRLVARHAEDARVAHLRASRDLRAVIQPQEACLGSGFGFGFGCGFGFGFGFGFGLRLGLGCECECECECD